MAHAVELIDRPEAAAAALHPLRRRILEQLGEADSAAGVARALSLPRQRVTYHVRELEKAGLVERVEERRRGNCVERLVRATARAYLIAPQAMGPVGPTGSLTDQFSSSYVVAVAGQTLRDMSELRRAADRAGKSLPTLTLQTEVRFGSAPDQHAFAEELGECLARLAAKYHDEHAEAGRTFRFNVVGYPRPVSGSGADEQEGEHS